MRRLSGGFTLVELLIVVVIIGILATIAIPKFAGTKEKAYLAAMKSDLRNLVVAQEAYYYDSTKYTSAVADLAPLAFSVSADVTVTINAADQTGWDGKAVHGGATQTCTIWVGKDTGTGKEGVPVCS